jgi:hypothetical protein
MPLRAFTVLGALLLGPSPAVAAVSPAIAFSPQRVIASGLTPGGQVVWFGIAREISQRVATIVRRTKIGEADKDGAAAPELGKAGEGEVEICHCQRQGTGSSHSRAARFPVRSAS